MNQLQYHAPTAIYAGSYCIQNRKQLIHSFGKRAFVITSVFTENAQNYALEDVESVFKELNIQYKIYSDAEENPTVESIVRVVNDIRTFDPEYIFAIGGGSALDTAKAANVLLKHPTNANPYQVFYDGERCANTCNSGLLPMLAIPTTAGSGSEVMGFSILTRSDTHTKLRINQLSYFQAAFLDYRYVIESPQWLLDAGAMDSLAHGIEGLLNKQSCQFSRVWHLYGLNLFAGFKDALLTQTLGETDCENMLLAASVQGMGNMQSGTTIPHGMGYPLTHFKNVTHGIASIMTIPAFLEKLKNHEAVDEIVHCCGFQSLSDFSNYIETITARNVDISVSEQEIQEWAESCIHLSARIEKHIEPITKEMIADIYRKSLSRFMI